MTNAPDPQLEDALRAFMVEEALAASPPIEDVDGRMREGFEETLAELSGDDSHRAAAPVTVPARPERGQHAYLRDGNRPRPAGPRHPLLSPAAVAAAAAVLLLSIGAAVGLGGGFADDRADPADPGPGATPPGDVYMGTEGTPSEPLDVQTFTGSIDWSEAATELDVYEVTVKSESERYLDDTGIIYREESIFDSSWTCPAHIVLPPRFEIEVRAVGPDSVSAPIWSRRFSAPPQGPPR